MSYWSLVRSVVESADVVVEVLDARFPNLSRNKKLEGFVKEKGKTLVFLFNKSDLVDSSFVRNIASSFGSNCVFMSAKLRRGVVALKKLLSKFSFGKTIKVAFVGYPNTGKSSIINLLKGKKSAPTSFRAGFTKGLQNIRVSSNVVVIDTPGVIPVENFDESLLVVLSSKNSEDISDLESVGLDVAKLVLKCDPNGVKSLYNISASSPESLLESLALVRGKLKRGALPDISAAAKILIDDVQSGKL
ncbi:MAG: GTPase, partial [Candidatus Diapherotrites archaeon]